jgi:enoyl-CoA hydratase/carnithine racemase
VGLSVAKELILTGRRIGAARAKELGLVSEVVPAGSLGAAAARLAAELASAGPLAVTQAKKAIDGGFDLPLPEALAHERDCYEIVLESEDRNEGLAAFAEKRPPSFKGK